MKIVLLFVLLAFVPVILARADDDAALTSDSTADQVSAVLDHQIHKTIDAFPNVPIDPLEHFPDSRIDRTEGTTTAVDKLGAVKNKTLIDLLGLARPYGADYDHKTHLKREILFLILLNHADVSDIPDLLACSAPEALWVICAHPDWCNNPAVSAFLATQLKDLSSTQAGDQIPNWILNDYIPAGWNYSDPTKAWRPSEAWQWTILNLASLDDDPATQKLLVDTIQHAIDNGETHSPFLCDALEVVSRSHNPQMIALASGLMGRLNAINDFPSKRVWWSLNRIVDNNPDVLKDPKFGANAIPFVDKCSIGFPAEDLLMKARLGDSKSFVYTISNYNNQDYFPYISIYAPDPKTRRQVFKGYVENQIIKPIVTRGSGDKAQLIKEHYRTAVYQDGLWVVFDPNDATATQETPSTPGIASPASPAPVAHVQAQPDVNKAAPVPGGAVATNPNAATASLGKVTVAIHAPMTILDSSGNVTAVTKAKIGDSYDVVRDDGMAWIMKDASGTQYRIAKKSVSALAPPGAPAPVVPIPTPVTDPAAGSN